MTSPTTGIPTEGTRSTCTRCGRTLWLRQTATTGYGSIPPNAPVDQWIARRGAKPRPIECPVSDGYPMAYHQPKGYEARYYGDSR